MPAIAAPKAIAAAPTMSATGMPKTVDESAPAIEVRRPTNAEPTVPIKPPIAAKISGKELTRPPKRP